MRNVWSLTFSICLRSFLILFLHKQKLRSKRRKEKFPISLHLITLPSRRNNWGITQISFEVSLSRGNVHLKVELREFRKECTKSSSSIISSFFFLCKISFQINWPCSLGQSHYVEMCSGLLHYFSWLIRALGCSALTSHQQMFSEHKLRCLYICEHCGDGIFTAPASGVKPRACKT